ncbi:bifunctional DNA-formamidopyrimidine glycosylase/DNA-(apurinic or apyrimidinic site) lyase [Planococcus halotolerans]|uniref:Formamidopyrimidine-DNA glycosylase n=1 Tax=Planococcus halotolerans TaxID=2233542 RepID=A0A365KN61_9BACL|nr:bifunctional DNA-formamidopyrimidine glycosylase/DNA-(apurinic or apyrimidinic site) lyase [Planococcus halotolerans]RAZ74100.1 DNA-formamidopyrimidine glycosylase [Planococcus halotolerans]
MPELPEVEGVVRQIRPVAIGKKIEDVYISDTIRLSKTGGREAILKKVEADSFIDKVKGSQITSVERRSKYIYFGLRKDSEFLLVNHLGMSGAWFYVGSLMSIPEEKFRKHVHVVLTLNDGNILAYSDIRRFGEMRVLNDEGDYPPLLLMAPEPFDENALQHFLDMSESPKYRNKPIKEVIMDGQVISGAGNIYATEALFSMKIHPNRAAHRISRKRRTELFKAVVDILLESIEAGGSTISDYRNINGESGGMQNRFAMYGKKQCMTCGSVTKTLKIGGRTSVYCPTCQK